MKPTLDYQSPIVDRRFKSERRKMAVGTGAGFGAALTLPAFFLALISAGAGHGDYGFARGFFPLPMLVAAYVTGSISLPSIALACIQFPLYGAALGYGATARRQVFFAVTLFILIAHLAAFIAVSEGSQFSRHSAGWEIRPHGASLHALSFEHRCWGILPISIPPSPQGGQRVQYTGHVTSGALRSLVIGRGCPRLTGSIRFSLESPCPPSSTKR